MQMAAPDQRLLPLPQAAHLVLSQPCVPCATMSVTTRAGSLCLEQLHATMLPCAVESRAFLPGNSGFAAADRMSGHVLQAGTLLSSLKLPVTGATAPSLWGARCSPALMAFPRSQRTLHLRVKRSLSPRQQQGRRLRGPLPSSDVFLAH